MRQFLQGGLCGRCCGLSKDLEERANFGRPFGIGSLKMRITFSFETGYEDVGTDSGSRLFHLWYLHRDQHASSVIEIGDSTPVEHT